MTDVEDAYRAAVDAMTPTQKIERIAELNKWAHRNIERCITAELGPHPHEVLKWRVSLWSYGRGDQAVKWINSGNCSRRVG